MRSQTTPHATTQHHTLTVERCIELANTQLIGSWRRLPPLASISHVPILQAAQRVQELAESNQVRESGLVVSASGYCTLWRTVGVHEHPEDDQRLFERDGGGEGVDERHQEHREDVAVGSWMVGLRQSPTVTATRRRPTT